MKNVKICFSLNFPNAAFVILHPSFFFTFIHCRNKPAVQMNPVQLMTDLLEWLTVILTIFCSCKCQRERFSK